MSGQDKRSSRSVRVSNKSPIAQPPRAALSGRSSRADQPDGPSSEANPESTAPDAEAESSGDNEKTARIDFLEKDMAVMEEEFSRELTQLGQKLTNESEVSLFWQQKHSTLHQQFLKVDTELRMLKHEVASRDKQREEREKDVKTRISSLILDRDTLREGYHVAKMDLQHKDEEISQLRTQIKGLKDFVSTSSRTDGQVTDEVFGEMMQRLGNSLQNWVIQYFRKAKIDVSKSKREIQEELQELVPTYAAQVSTAKIHLIQSIISRLLVTAVFDSYFVGLPGDRASELRSVEQFLGSITGGMSCSNQWRSSTLAALRKEALGRFQPAADSLVTTLVSRINNILDNISDVQHSDARDQSLRSLLNSAVDLSRLLRVQKAIFKTIMPVIEGHQINIFDTDTMEDVGGEDEDSLEGREICCATFPGMIKEGDEAGEHAQLKNVIAKARILCSPG